MKRQLWAIVFFVNALFTFAENETQEKTDALKSIFSFDAGYTMTALKNNGLGFGFNYERKLADFLSIKPGAGQMLFYSDLTTISIITIDLQLFLYYYPLSGGLDKLFIGLGAGGDYVTYNKKMANDFFVSILSVIGWKWKILPFLMVEPFIGWKSLMYGTDSYENAYDYVNGGFQWGISLKLFRKTM